MSAHVRTLNCVRSIWASPAWLLQVYKATVRCSDGSEREVAVKVGHPGVAKLLQMDFSIMKALAEWVEGLRLPFLRSLPLKESVAQFSATMGAQADLRVEAAHLERFYNAFASGRQVLYLPLTESWGFGAEVTNTAASVPTLVGCVSKVAVLCTPCA